MAFARVRQSLMFLYLSLLATTVIAEDNGWTTRHEKGRCAIKGQCGKQSFFGSELPCPNNTLAEQPEDEMRQRLVSICGQKWSEGPVCCQNDQLEALTSNLKRAESIISSCPACKDNFFNLFCTFTCSPDQSLFVNVTDTGASTIRKRVVTELDVLVSDEYSSGFYNSCKDVKFSTTNAMDFIGGGAKNYTAFLKFLGDKKFLGSPFQINFPRPNGASFQEMEAMNNVPKQCNDTDSAYRCPCVDCPAVCPELPEISETKRCYIGALPCLSFAVILVYSVFILILVGTVSGHVAYQKHSQRKSERLRLLQDAAPSDDEDEGDVVHNPGMMDRPQKNYYLNTFFDNAFSRLGSVCARFPLITILITIIVVGLMSVGWVRFAVETNPVRLWVSPSSDAANEKAFFDSNFGPFFRAEQAFLVNDTSSSGPSPVLSYDNLGWWFDVENRIQRLMSVDGLTLNDFCFKPTGTACVIQSLTGYFQGSFAAIDPANWQTQIRQCTDSPVGCLPSFQQPLQKEMILGGWEQTGDVLDSKALIVTWVVNNHAEGTRELERAARWEASLKSTLQAVQGEARDRGLRLSFSTEISLEEELNKSTNTDAKIVVISYIIMFIYASLALGSATLTARSILHNPANALVQSKFTLGVIGIIIVLMSVSASVGLFSAAGIPVTLIIAEVIPFLVLAVGVDNIFLIVHEFERVNISHPDEAIEDRVAKALGRMGPSILLSASTETIAIALGAAVGMPAVKNFAVYAAGAVLINAVLQVTMFVSVLALNQRRVEASRADCFPCVRVRKADTANGHGGQRFVSEEEGGLQRFIRKTYAPALLARPVKVMIMVVFLGIFTAGVALIPKVKLGLDQRIALPSDSYLISYFNDLDTYFDTGPPVYFVTRALNVTERYRQQQLCNRFTTCNTFSLANVLEQERKRPKVSFIAEPAASWIDDYFQWLNPTFTDCCVENNKVCFKGRDPPWNTTLYGMPEGDEFLYYLEKWIQSPTGIECPLAGKAQFGDALVIDAEHKTIPASHFRSSHPPLRSQSDFIDAYASARRIANTINEHNPGVEVFPYSKFYVFFDQYASIVRLTATLLCSALALILIISSILLGSLWTGAVVTGTVIMIVVDVIGAMAVIGVSLNALSLVNLVICVGIGVEFCAHIARAFMFPSRNVMERGKSKFRGRDARAWTALVNVGGSVLSGITITKLLGVFVLAFTRSKIFEIYYFRIWLALVIFASTHALIFLPVALSFIGGDGYIDPESDGGLEQDLTSRRYRGMLADDDDDDSDDY